MDLSFFVMFIYGYSYIHRESGKSTHPNSVATLDSSDQRTRAEGTPIHMTSVGEKCVCVLLAAIGHIEVDKTALSPCQSV